MSENTERPDIDADGLYSRISGMLQSLDALKRYKDERSIELPKCADGEYVRIGDEIVHPNGKRGQVIGIDYRRNETYLFVLGDNGLAYTCELNQVRHARTMEEEAVEARGSIDIDELVEVAEMLREPWDEESYDGLGNVNEYEAWLARRILAAICKGGAE